MAFTICIMLLAGFILAGCGSGSEQPSPGFEFYRNSQYSFSLQVPVDWTKPDNTPGAAIQFYAPLQDSIDTVQENLNIIVQNLGQNMTLDDYSQPYLQQLQLIATNGFQVSDVTLAGLPAKQAIFTKVVDSRSIDFRQIWTLKGTRAYGLTFTSETSQTPQYSAIFDHMAASFKLGG